MAEREGAFKASNYDYKGPFTLREIAEVIGCKIDDSKADVSINSLAPLSSASEGSLTFFDNTKYLEQFKNARASACIVNAKYAEHAPKTMTVLVVDEPYRSYARIAQKFYPARQPDEEIHPQAVIHKTAKIGKGTSIGASTVIGRDVVIGENCRISPNVTLQSCRIGNNCIIHAGVRIGQDGFGFAMGQGEHIKVPQLGGVIIGNDVEIGSNTCVDRGSGPDTIIGDGTKIDNLVQIGHNVEIGRFCVIVSQVGIAGSTKIGDYVVLGGKSGLNGHIKVGTGAIVAAFSGVLKNVEPGATVGGQPAVAIRDWHKQILALEKLGKGNKE